MRRLDKRTEQALSHLSWELLSSPIWDTPALIDMAHLAFDYLAHLIQRDYLWSSQRGWVGWLVQDEEGCSTHGLHTRVTSTDIS